MNKWQEHFAQKLELVRDASRDRFEQVAEETITPTYEDFKRFAKQQGLQSAVPLIKNGIRTFKFAIAENAYTLMTFRLAGLAHCELHREFFVPNHEPGPPVAERIELNDVAPDWVVGTFESTLDMFIEAFVDSLASENTPAKELVGSK